MLFWPTIHETWVTKICKELAAWAVLLLTLGTAIWSTVRRPSTGQDLHRLTERLRQFVISQRTAYANGATEEELAQIHTWQPPFRAFSPPPARQGGVDPADRLADYKDYPPVIAFIVLFWVGWLFIALACVFLLWL